LLPGFEQYVKTQTRNNNILDKCFVNVRDAYVSKSMPPILNSDHNVVHMNPVYRTKFKRSKPERKMIRMWSNESVEQLRACFDWTNWEIFDEGSLDERTTVLNDYINFCVELNIPTKEIRVYPNNKPYVTKGIKEIINVRKVAFKEKDIRTLKQTERELKIKLNEAKEVHKKCLEKAFKINNSKKVWDIMKTMSGLSPSKKIYCS